SAVVRSHHVPVSECEAQARKALGIARAIDDPRALAAALHSLPVVVWDPYRRNTQRAWLDELLDLAVNHPHEPWLRWALPILARVRVIEGDVVGGGAALEQLAREAAESGDIGAIY